MSETLKQAGGVAKTIVEEALWAPVLSLVFVAIGTLANRVDSVVIGCSVGIVWVVGTCTRQVVDEIRKSAVAVAAEAHKAARGQHPTLERARQERAR